MNFLQTRVDIRETRQGNEIEMMAAKWFKLSPKKGLSI